MSWYLVLLTGLDFNQINYVDQNFLDNVPLSPMKIDTYNSQPQMVEFIQQFKSNRTVRLHREEVKQENVFKAKFHAISKVFLE